MAANNQVNIANKDPHSLAASAMEKYSKSDGNVSVFNRALLQELGEEIDPTLHLDEDVAKLLLAVADDFIRYSLSNAFRMAKHRGSSIVELKDVEFEKLIKTPPVHHAPVYAEKRATMTSPLPGIGLHEKDD